MEMKKLFAVVTAVAFLSFPVVVHAASSSSTNDSNSTSGSNAASSSGSNASGNANASAYSNGSESLTKTNTTSVTVGNVGINTNDSKNINKTQSLSLSKSVNISGNALSKNDLSQMVTNNQHAAIYDNHNPNSMNNHAFENASGVMNVSQESGVNNASMQTVNVNNSAGLH